MFVVVRCPSGQCLLDSVGSGVVVRVVSYPRAHDGGMQGAAVWAATNITMVDPAGWSRGDCLAGLSELERISREVAAMTACLITVLGVDGRDTAATIAKKCGVSTREARNRVAVAKVAAQLPEAGQALAEGALSAEHVRMLEPVATKPGAVDLVSLGCVSTPEELRRAVTEFEMADDDGRELSERQHVARTMNFFDGPHGMIGFRGQLPPIEGTLLRNTLRGLVDVKWRKEHPERAETLGGHGSEPYDRRLADALIELVNPATAPAIGNSLRTPDVAGRPAVVVVFNADTLAAEVVGHGPVPLNDALRYTQQADFYAIVRNMHGAVLKFGRDRRFASPMQTLAVIVRDRHCQYPGCTTDYTRADIHHLREWDADRGSTDLDNLTLLCEQHHTHLHRNNEQLTRQPDGTIQLRFRTEVGTERAPPTETAA
jgi:hypothetical protein